MKLSHLKLANSIRVGTEEKQFFAENEYEIDLVGILIRIEFKRDPKQKGFTSLFNTVYFHSNEEPTGFAPKEENLSSAGGEESEQSEGSRDIKVSESVIRRRGRPKAS
jgi:hypothetical protein